MIAVVRPEARQVDVSDEKHPVGLYEEAAMPSRVAGEMDDRHCATTKIEHLFIFKARGVCARRVVEVGPQLFGPGRPHGLWHSVHVEQTFEGVQRTDIEAVSAHPSLGKAPDASKVIFVGMRHNDTIDCCWRSASFVDVD